MKIYYLLSLFILFSQFLYSQEFLSAGGGEYVTPIESNCLSESQRLEIQQMLDNNRAMLRKQGKLSNENLKTDAIVSFDWPLQKAAGLSYYSYYSTNNFVDQNTSTGLLDYHCDTRTYDGHHGTDIDTWPFPWYLYENNFVEVIAAEAGIIISNTDGKADDHCSCMGDWNAVYVQHADESVAWYGHMKKNSLTPKAIGQSVAKGEYLGVVASSGCSTGPHLHFEVYNASNQLIDPYYDTCNSLNNSSWWASQRPNREPTLNALLTHDAIPVHGCPGANESPNISNLFDPGQTVYFATYYHDQLFGDLSNLRIKRPDGSVWQNWTHTSSGTYTRSWWHWNLAMPIAGPFGTWTFEVDYKGQTFSHDFELVNPVSVDGTSLPEVSIFPNPTSGKIEIIGVQNCSVEVYDIFGKTVFKSASFSNVDISKASSGVYFVKIEAEGKVFIGKIIKE